MLKIVIYIKVVYDCGRASIMDVNFNGMRPLLDQQAEKQLELIPTLKQRSCDVNADSYSRVFQRL